MPATRAILHVDMDAFFAAIEQLDHPHLRGKPVLVGSDRPRGVVSTASYEARAFGCHSALPMAIARQRCPQAIVMPVRGKRYREFSKRLFAILDDFSPLVEPLSIDEAFVDVTGADRLFGPPVEIAHTIQQRVRDQLQLTCSIGIAKNKFLAKLASDMHKPDGLTPVTDADLDGWFADLPIEKIWGIGPRSAQRLHDRGITTIADIRALDDMQLQQVFGNEADRYDRLSRGIDDRPVHPDHQTKSISHEVTFEQDIEHSDEVRRVLFDLIEQVCWRLRKHRLLARGVFIKVRYGDFETINRSATLDRATDTTAVIWEAIGGLYDRWADRDYQPVRLIGGGVERLTTTPGQLGLFESKRADSQSKIDQAADRIIDRFGKGAIKRAGSLDSHRPEPR